MFTIDPNQKVNLLKVEVDHLQKISKLLNDAAMQNSSNKNDNINKRLRKLLGEDV